ncbi:hypothetical protein ND991_17935 [Gordonia sputi]|uniref:hypothetical protein n=1 Tax=Gordonia TaxID=2053 RepID=UPI002043F1DB|nr:MULTISPECIES: hypothetical protein [Gordonia]MCM3897089.1 hypothetical protein [Gordonia sputi]
MPRKKNFRPSELRERGWNDVRRRHHPLTRGNSGYLIDEVLAVEATPEWQEDNLRAQQGLPEEYSRADIRGRGWSDAMIRDLLDVDPITVRLNNSGTRIMHLWRAAPVEAAEATPGFGERLEQAAKRSTTARKVAEQRAEEVREAAREAAATLEMFDLPATIDDLEALAIASSRSLDGPGSYRALDRWCDNYLRHECSDYDYLLAELTSKFRGVPGVGEIYAEIVRPRIDDLVLEARSQIGASDKPS